LPVPAVGGLIAGAVVGLVALAALVTVVVALGNAA
jgi:hypothetical protein